MYVTAASTKVQDLANWWGAKEPFSGLRICGVTGDGSVCKACIVYADIMASPERYDDGVSIAL